MRSNSLGQYDFLSRQSSLLDSKLRNLLCIRTILIASNGMSAIKFIHSLTDFSFSIFNKQVFKFYGLATKEDVLGSYDYIKHLDNFKVVEAFDVKTIVGASLEFGVDAVFPGWGHESENPLLPLYMHQVNSKCKFIGPSCWPVYILGNKVVSNLLCEKLSIEVIPWCKPEELNYELVRKKIDALQEYYTKQQKNCDKDADNIACKIGRSVSGDRVYCASKLPGNMVPSKANNTGTDSEETKDESLYTVCKKNLDDLNDNIQAMLHKNDYLPFINKNSFPLIVKSPTLGGGRGIYVLENHEDIRILRRFPGFLSKLLEETNHIEIQLAIDNYGNVLFLGARDCTTQRRNQKLIEESIIAPRNMVKDAIKIIKSVKYTGLATIEFIKTKTCYYFLEVNTRMQVEHPVSELQCKTNIPAIAYLIACGICISNIERLLRFKCNVMYFCENTGNISMTKEIDRHSSNIIRHDLCEMYKCSGNKASEGYARVDVPNCFKPDFTYHKHVIGIRIISESSTFQPSIGHVTVSHPYLKNVYSYFSVTNGIISATMDSQIGHIFSVKKSRTSAILQLVKYLNMIKIRGIETPIQFYKKYLMHEEFYNSKHSSSTVLRMLKNTEDGNKLEGSSTRDAIHGNESTCYVKEDTGIETMNVMKNDLPNNESLGHLREFGSGSHDAKLLILAFIVLFDSNHVQGSFMYNGLLYLPSTYRIAPSELLIRLNDTYVAIKYTFIGKRLIISYKNRSCIINYKFVQQNLRIEHDGIHTAYPYHGDYITSPQDGRITKINRNCKNINDIVCEIELMKVTNIILSKHESTLKFLVNEGDLVTEGQNIAKVEDKVIIQASKMMFEGFNNDRVYTYWALVGFELPDELWTLPENLIEIWLMLSIHVNQMYRNEEQICMHKVHASDMHQNTVYKLHALLDSKVMSMYKKIKLFCQENNSSSTNIKESLGKLVKLLSTKLSKQLNKLKTLLEEKIQTAGSIEELGLPHTSEHQNTTKINITADITILLSSNLSSLFYTKIEEVMYDLENLDLLLLIKSCQFLHECLHRNLSDNFYVSVFLASKFHDEKCLVNFTENKAHVQDHANHGVTKPIFVDSGVRLYINNRFCDFSITNSYPYVNDAGLIYSSSSLHIYAIFSGIKAIVFHELEYSFKVIKLFYNKRNCTHAIVNLYGSISYDDMYVKFQDIKECVKELNVFTNKKEGLGCFCCLGNGITCSNPSITNDVMLQDKQTVYHTCFPSHSVEPSNYRLQYKFTYWRNVIESFTNDQYNIALKSIYKKLNLFQDLADIQSMRRYIMPTYNFELQKQRNFAMKNNTMIPEDFMDIVKVYLEDCVVSELYLHNLSESTNSKSLTTVPLNSKNFGYQDVHTSNLQFDFNSFNKYYVDYESSKTKVGIKVGIKAYEIVYCKRKVMFLINDISYMNGSFSLPEYAIFKLVTDRCLQFKIPRIFISNNSGARVGIFSNLMDDILESGSKSINTSTEMSNLSLTAASQITCTKHQTKINDPKPYCNNTIEQLFGGIHINTKLVDKYSDSALFYKNNLLAIYGNSNTGPENLSFSAKIAVQTAQAYNEIFTLSYVSGISVGIGAYVNRLGRRIIQKRSAPILLTGTRVLNKLTGSNLRLSNLDVGGPQVLATNGTVYKVVNDDYEGIEAIFKWLDYYFCNRMRKATEDENIHANTDGSNNDRRNIEKELEEVGGKESYLHKLELHKNETYNEREILELILDSYSFEEYQESWAPNVIVGRGKVNKVSIGIISPEVTPHFENTQKEFNHANSYARRNSDNTKSNIGLKVQGVDTTGTSDQDVSSVALFNVRKQESLLLTSAQKSSEKDEPKMWIPNVMQTETAAKIAQAIQDFSTENLDILILANWKGFSAGVDDMNREVIKNGAKIIDALTTSTSRILVYLVPNGQLRGGTWVVFDKNISKNIRIVSHATTEVGTLQPGGLAELKIKEKWDMGEEYCKIHDQIYRMWARGMVDELVSVNELRQYITKWLEN